ncbi:MAG: PilZ domain-containing protein, partial [Thermoanaerobaculia bacterium]
MNRERRKATRVPLPEAVRATVDDVPVRVLDLSTVNARVEHEQRFPLQSPRLRLEWHRSEIQLPFRVMRSQIVARKESGLVYHSGIEFIALDPLAEGLIASIL